MKINITEQDTQDFQAIAPMLSESEREKLGVVKDLKEARRRQSSIYKQTTRDLEAKHGPGLKTTLVK